MLWLGGIPPELETKLKVRDDLLNNLLEILLSFLLTLETLQLLLKKYKTWIEFLSVVYRAPLEILNILFEYRKLF